MIKLNFHIKKKNWANVIIDFNLILKKLEINKLNLRKIIITMNKYLNNEMNNSYIFIDLSNIYIGFYNYIMYNNKKYNICNPKMDYNVLFSILEKDKKVERRILVGSKNKKIENKKILKKKIMNYFY